MRYFGLCGADPRAIQAVAELGDLLGLTESGGAVEREYAAGVRQQAVDELCGRLPDHLRGKMLGRTIPDVVESIRQALSEPPR